MPIQVICTVCGKVSLYKPSIAYRIANPFICRKCRHDNPKIVTMTCVDCGKTRTAPRSAFKQPPETYRCKPCNCKFMAKDPQWLVNKTNSNREIAKNPIWKENHANAMKELPLDPEWNKHVKEGVLNSWKKPERLEKHKNSMRDHPTWLNSIKAAALIRKDNPVWRANNKKALQKLHRDPEFRKSQLIGAQCFETRKKLSMAYQGITNEEDWPGFLKVIDSKYCGKWSDPKYKVRKRVRSFFNDTCIICHKTTKENDGRHMSVHHILRKKDACCDGDKSDWIFASLCKSCHAKSHNTYAEQLLREIVALEYGGKCMLSLSEYNQLYSNGSDLDKKWGWSNGS